VSAVFLKVDTDICRHSVSEEDRASSIVSNILSHVKEECNACDLQVEDITDIRLTCGNDQISATFRALLLGDPVENELVTTNLEKWVEANADINLGDFTVKLNGECEVVINSFGDDFCSVQRPQPTSTPTTTPPDTPTTESTSNRGSDKTAGIVIPIVIIIMLVIVAIVVLVVVVLLFRRHQTQKSTDPYLNFEEHETAGTARLSQTLYETGESREYDNPIYGQQEDEIVKTDLEREYLEDPSILK
jgi:hypothetical protein